MNRICMHPGFLQSFRKCLLQPCVCRQEYFTNTQNGLKLNDRRLNLCSNSPILSTRMCVINSYENYKCAPNSCRCNRLYEIINKHIWENKLRADEQLDYSPTVTIF